MATPSESDKGLGKGKTEESSSSSSGSDRPGAQLASEEVQPKPYDPDDAQRSERIAALNGEGSEFLSAVGVRPVGYSSLTPAQLRAIHRDVEERSGWSETQQDVYRGLLRLGHRVPGRAGRLL